MPYDKRILLLTVPITDEFDGEVKPIMMDKTRSHPPIGVYLMAAILRRARIPFRLFDMIAAGMIEHSDIDHEYENSDIIALPANSLNWPSALRIIRRIRVVNPEAIIILGNIHGTMFPEYILEKHAVDYILRGEAEMTFPRLIESLLAGRDPYDIPGLCFRRDGNVHISPDMPTLDEEQLNDNPPPLWEIVPDKAYTSISIESSRGCRFNCVFCSIPYRKRWRSLSARQFYLNYQAAAPHTDRTRTNVLSITDDCFTLDKQRVLDILSYFKTDKVSPAFTLDARASDLCDEELCSAIAPYTNAILVGAESGYAEGLKRIRKGITIDNIIRTAENVHKFGIAERTVFSFVLGLPWESYHDVMRTVEFAFGLYARYGTRLYLQWHNLIPGSRIWYNLFRENKISLADYDRTGFFRNCKLMDLGVACSHDEVFKICDKILSLMNLSTICDKINCKIIESVSFSVPWHLEKQYYDYYRRPQSPINSDWRESDGEVYDQYSG
jgi:radical SAM superfamily enzyme YgiQ (UPF0313 family)